MVDRGKIILVKQVAEQFNNYPGLLRSVPRLRNEYARITEEILLNYKKVDANEIPYLMDAKNYSTLVYYTHQIVSDKGPYYGDTPYSTILRDNTVYAKALFNEIKEMLVIPYIMPIYVSDFGTQEQYANTILRLKSLHIYELIINIFNPPEIILIPIAMLSLTLTRSLFENICFLRSNIVEKDYNLNINIIEIYYKQFCDNMFSTVKCYNSCKNDYSYFITKRRL